MYARNEIVPQWLIWRLFYSFLSANSASIGTKYGYGEEQADIAAEAAEEEARQAEITRNLETGVPVDLRATASPFAEEDEEDG